MKRVVTMCVVLALGLSTVSAQVRFGGLDLNSSSELLFSAEATVPRYGRYNSLFLADIPGGTLSQLTVFPERMAVLGSGGELQIQNRFGVFRIDLADEEAEGDTDETTVTQTPAAVPVPVFPAFVDGDDIQTGKTFAVVASPDGRYLSYLDPTSAGYGRLVLYDTIRGETHTVSENVELVLDEVPATWAPDSSFIVYSKANEIYYLALQQVREGRVLPERLRRVGSGTTASVTWAENNTLFYVSGSTVYRILGVEFFTRSLYQDLLRIGSIVGKLPWRFDPNFDEFWIAPDGESILVSKDGRNVNVLFLQADDYLSTGETLSLPYLYLPRNTRVREVLWSDNDRVTVLTGTTRITTPVSTVFRLNLADPDSRSSFTATDDEAALQIALSPDQRRALVAFGDRVEVRAYATWDLIATIEHADVIEAAWDSANALVVAGRTSVNRYSLGDTGSVSEDRLLALAQVESWGFDVATGGVVATVDGQTMRYTGLGWSAVNEEIERAPTRVASEDHRVYLEGLSRGSYGNMIMVRNVASFGTQPLFARPSRRYEPFPASDDPIDFANFDHGSRIRRREVGLVFNAIDSVAGLTEILTTLDDYDVTATFFVNGDFIRRHPGAVSEISASGHEVGSLFYTYFDMADSRFQVTTEFIQQGLARNEDEYFEATGRELSLLWHAPYYFVSPQITAAGEALNYSYIGRDVDSLDWVPQRDENGLARLYRPTADLIEDVIASKQPGSIIAMTVGRPGDDRTDGGRDDYLFQRLDVLLDGLVERGYAMVSVSTLIENAR